MSIVKNKQKSIIKKESKNTSNEQTSSQIQLKKKRGRPRKLRTPEELAKIEEAKKNKLSLAEKQELKLKLQKEREAKKAAAGELEPKNKDRFYCNNRDLHNELLKWRNSDLNGIRIQKMVGDKLIPTEIDNSNEGHEQYKPGIRYFVRLHNVDDSHYEEIREKDGSLSKRLVQGYETKLLYKAKSELEEKRKEKGLDGIQFYKQTKDYITHEITDIVKKEGWTFNYDIVEERVISDLIGEMMIKIGRKLSNHSNFRNYSPELKDDMVFFGIQKLIKGLKNYNFKFSNPFAWFSQAFWNSFLTTIYRHYKQMNIKKDLMKKLSMELETYNGIDPRSSLNKAIKQFLGEEFDIED